MPATNTAAARVAALRSMRAFAAEEKLTFALHADVCRNRADSYARSLGFKRADPFYRTLCTEYTSALRGRLVKA